MMKPFNPENFLILIVDDLGRNLQTVGSMLDREGYLTTFALSGPQALARIPMAQPDLILLDLMMPQMDGIQVCQQIKTEPAWREIPIIILSASNDSEQLLQAFKSGAVDYITKPFNSLELLARVKTHLKLKDTRDQLKQALAELEVLATTDVLTGVANRRFLFTWAKQYFAQLDFQVPSLSVLMVDIDHFKDINDTHGHAMGDSTLRLVAQTIKQILRPEDCFGRFGGEEFVAFLPQTTILQAREIAENIRRTVGETALLVTGRAIHLTVSIGVANSQSTELTIEPALKRADDGLRQAKSQGRDRVVVDLAKSGAVKSSLFTCSIESKLNTKFIYFSFKDKSKREQR